MDSAELTAAVLPVVLPCPLVPLMAPWDPDAVSRCAVR